jgi:hypothetical protein
VLKAFGFDGPFDFLPDKLDTVFIDGIGPSDKIKRYGVLRRFPQAEPPRAVGKVAVLQ